MRSLVLDADLGQIVDDELGFHLEFPG